MPDFFRFPHTPHLAWLGKDTPRDDKVLSKIEAQQFLAQIVTAEEKIDGANLGISLDEQGQLRCQNRGQYLNKPYTGQFSRLSAWLSQNETALREHLLPHLILFGEWCAAKHSITYHGLTDWFLVFDVYDKHEQQFWSSERRNQFANTAGLHTVSLVYQGKTTLTELKKYLDRTSHYAQHTIEGLVIRQENADYCLARAKLVRPDFTQAIEEHWRNKAIEWNRTVDLNRNKTYHNGKL